MASRQNIAYLFTTFPKATETFLQREIIAMQRMGAQLEIHSLWGGGGKFGGMPVHAFNKWLLVKLFWIIPWVALTRWDVFGVLLKGLLTRGAPSWLNFWENMLGAGFAGVFYRSFRRAGVDFEARIVGDGPLRDELGRAIRRLNLAGQVSLAGHLALDEVWGQLAWADVLVHTGIVAASGDRDGLPNVIPEAMSIGAMVVSSPVAATTEAVRHGVTGLVADVARPDAWVTALRRLATDADLAESLRIEARRWVEENFDAHKNAARLSACFEAQTRS
ncbi:glycosyltransferase family 4 protein [Termitidicoccus mucosus]|uniref:glycosyltransferase family 4 protein n=1 Tax=Termitidicoccus mucosus TaxID=1184151 RepID=UPI003183F157